MDHYRPQQDQEQQGLQQQQQQQGEKQQQQQQQQQQGEKQQEQQGQKQQQQQGQKQQQQQQGEKQQEQQGQKQQEQQGQRQQQQQGQKQQQEQQQGEKQQEQQGQKQQQQQGEKQQEQQGQKQQQQQGEKQQEQQQHCALTHEVAKGYLQKLCCPFLFLFSNLLPLASAAAHRSEPPPPSAVSACTSSALPFATAAADMSPLSLWYDLLLALVRVHSRYLQYMAPEGTAAAGEGGWFRELQGSRLSHEAMSDAVSSMSDELLVQYVMLQTLNTEEQLLSNADVLWWCLVQLGAMVKLLLMVHNLKIQAQQQQQAEEQPDARGCHVGQGQGPRVCSSSSSTTEQQSKSSSSSKPTLKGSRESFTGAHFLPSSCSLVEIPIANQQLQQQIDGACPPQVLAAVEALVRSGRDTSACHKKWEELASTRIEVYGEMLGIMIAGNILPQLREAASSRDGTSSGRGSNIDKSDRDETRSGAGGSNSGLEAGSSVDSSNRSTHHNGVDEGSSSSKSAGGDHPSSSSSGSSSSEASIGSAVMSDISSALLSAGGLAMFLNAGIVHMQADTHKGDGRFQHTLTREERKVWRQGQRALSKAYHAKASCQLSMWCLTLAPLIVACLEVQAEVQEFVVRTAPVLLRLMIHQLQNQPSSPCTKLLIQVVLRGKGFSVYLGADTRSILLGADTRSTVCY